MHRRLSSVKGTCGVVVTSQRWATTGFGLFTAEVQRREGVLKAKCLQEGRQNMKVMSALWHQLSRRERMTYNKMANRMSITRVRNAHKKHNVFNLVMRLLARHRELIAFGNEKFIALVAKQTVRILRRDDIERLCDLFSVRAATVLAGARTGHEQCAVLDMPDMKYFSSFTEMQRAVMPTRQSAYTSICKVLARHVERTTHDERMVSFFQRLTRDEQNLFGPIADDEAARFETFCAKYAAPMHPNQFNIVYLFAQYRGIAVNDRAARPQHSERAALYHTLLAQDRVHDGIYFKVRRALERVQHGRSSDCGAYVTTCVTGRSQDTCRVVPPSSYGLARGVDEVTVSTLLAQTRRGQSVYDDVLLRAAVLRPRSKASKLEVYIVKDDVKRSSAMANARTLQPIVETLKMPLSPEALRAARRMAESASMTTRSLAPVSLPESPAPVSTTQDATPQDATLRTRADPKSITVTSASSSSKMKKVVRQDSVHGRPHFIASPTPNRPPTAPAKPETSTQPDAVSELAASVVMQEEHVSTARRQVKRAARNRRQTRHAHVRAAPATIVLPRVPQYDVAAHATEATSETTAKVQHDLEAAATPQVRRRRHRRVVASRRELMEQLRTALMQGQPQSATVVKLASNQSTEQERAVKPSIAPDTPVEANTSSQSFTDQLRAQLASVLG